MRSIVGRESGVEMVDMTESGTGVAPLHRSGGGSKALEAFMVQHVSRVLEMVDFDLRKAAVALDIDLGELIVNIARWDARPVIVTKTTGTASSIEQGRTWSGEYVGLSPLEERCVDQ